MLNTAILMGRLTADPELRHTPSDVAVTSFTLAVDRSYVKSGADRQVDFIDIVAWRSTAEFVCRYFHKGQLVAVQGSIQTRSYTDKEGNKRKAFEVVADNVHFAEPKRDSSYSQAPAQQNAYRQETTEPAAYSTGNTGDFEEVLRLAGMTIPANRLARRRGTWALPYRDSIDRRFVGADVLGGPLYGDTDFSLWCHCEPAAGWRGNPFPRLLRRRHFQGGQSRPPLRLGSPFGGAVGAAD